MWLLYDKEADITPVINEILVRQMTVLGDLAAPGIVERIERFQQRRWSFTLSARARELKKPVAEKKFTRRLSEWAQGGHLLWTADELLLKLKENVTEEKKKEDEKQEKKRLRAEKKKVADAKKPQLEREKAERKLQQAARRAEKERKKAEATARRIARDAKKKLAAQEKLDKQRKKEEAKAKRNAGPSNSVTASAAQEMQDDAAAAQADQAARKRKRASSKGKPNAKKPCIEHKVCRVVRRCLCVGRCRARILLGLRLVKLVSVCVCI